MLDQFELKLLKGAKILAFKMVDASPYIWVLSPETEEYESRYFILVGTGFEIDIPECQLNFIDTVIDGKFVWHLFEDIT
jgi:hypothetical protein